MSLTLTQVLLDNRATFTVRTNSVNGRPIMEIGDTSITFDSWDQLADLVAAIVAGMPAEVSA